eukprot:344991_1
MFNNTNHNITHVINTIDTNTNGAHSKLEKLIREYLSINTQTEHTFLNGLKELNCQRIKSQTQNWSNFVSKLQSLYATELQSIQTQKHKNVLPIIKTDNVSTLSNTTIKDSSPTIKKKYKSGDEHECVLTGCNKIYTTKGNLNRHLKDFHRLNPDLSPINNNNNNNKKDNINNNNNNNKNSKQTHKYNSNVIQ